MYMYLHVYKYIHMVRWLIIFVHGLVMSHLWSLAKIQKSVATDVMPMPPPKETIVKHLCIWTRLSEELWSLGKAWLSIRCFMV